MSEYSVNIFDNTICQYAKPIGRMEDFDKAEEIVDYLNGESLIDMVRAKEIEEELDEQSIDGLDDLKNIIAQADNYEEMQTRMESINGEFFDITEEFEDKFKEMELPEDHELRTILAALLKVYERYTAIEKEEEDPPVVEEKKRQAALLKARLEARVVTQRKNKKGW